MLVSVSSSVTDNVVAVTQLRARVNRASLCASSLTLLICNKVSSMWQMGVFLILLWMFVFLMNPPTPATSKKEEQRIALKFLVSSGLTPIQCWCKLQDVFHEATMSKTQVRVWSRHFKEEKMEASVKDLPKSGRPRTVRTAANVR